MDATKRRMNYFGAPETAISYSLRRSPSGTSHIMLNLKICKVPKDMGETISRLYSKNKHQILFLVRYMFVHFGINIPHN